MGGRGGFVELRLRLGGERPLSRSPEHFQKTLYALGGAVISIRRTWA